MSYPLALLGLGVLFFVLGDVATTALSARGSGSLSGRLARNLWSTALWLHRRWTNHRLLAYMGVLILIATIMTWTLLVWLGWGLVYLAGPSSVVGSSSGQAAGWPQVFYFTGNTMITLGNGEYRPAGAFWQAVTLLTATTGFFVVTLSVTYLLSVLPSVVLKRQMAAYLASLGPTPQDLVVRCWKGGMTNHLPTLMSGVGSLAQQHLAFPVLHYFHSGEVRTALPLRLAALDEALLMLGGGLEGCEEAARRLEPLRETVGDLIRSLQGDFFTVGGEAPPPPSLEPLRAAGLPVRTDRDFAEVVLGQGERRRLLALVRRDGWRWEDVYRRE